MAAIKITIEMLENLVFGYSKSPVKIIDVAYNPFQQIVTFDIAGVDVPDVYECRVVCTEWRNRAGQHFTTMEFENTGNEE